MHGQHTANCSASFAPKNARADTGADFTIHIERPSRLMETHAVLLSASMNAIAPSAISTLAAVPSCAHAMRTGPEKISAATPAAASITAPSPMFTRYTEQPKKRPASFANSAANWPETATRARR